MRRRIAAAAAAVSLCSLATSGCFDIEQTLTLDRSLSGTAGFRMKIDMEPMIGVMVRMQREMAGKTGEPTAEEMAKAREEFVASSKTKKQQSGDIETAKRELSGKLPAGVKLIDATMTEGDLSMAMQLVFGFDQLAKLAAIQLPKGKGDAAAEGPGNPIDSPFGGLKVVDEGATVLITGPPQNPMTGAKDQAPPDPATQKMVQDMFKGLRVAFTITAPMEVVEHNAHRKDGNTLVWEYNLKTLETLTPEQLGSSIRVRYRK